MTMTQKKIRREKIMCLVLSHNEKLLTWGECTEMINIYNDWILCIKHRTHTRKTKLAFNKILTN